MAHRSIALTTELREADSSSGQVGMPQTRGQAHGEDQDGDQERQRTQRAKPKQQYKSLFRDGVGGSATGIPRAHVQLTHQQSKQEATHQAPRNKVLCKMPTPPGLNAAPFFVKASLTFAFCFLCCFFWEWGMASLRCRHSGLGPLHVALLARCSLRGLSL